MSAPKDRALREFLSEAQEIVDAVGRVMLALDEARAAGAEHHALVNDAFRHVHSLKGLSGMFGLEGIAALSHGLETLLDALRLGKVEVTGRVVDLLFEAVELFGVGLAAAREGGDLPEDAVAAYLDRAEAHPTPTAAYPRKPTKLDALDLGEVMASVLTRYEEHRLTELLDEGRSIHRVSASFPLLTVDEDLEALRARLEALGEVVTSVPGAIGDDPDLLEMVLLLGSKEPAHVIAAAAGEGVTVEVIGQRGAAPPGVPAIPSLGRPPGAFGPLPEAARAAAASRFTATPTPVPLADSSPSLRSVSSSVRVDIERLDALMNAVGELALVQSGLAELLGHLRGRGLLDEGRVLRHQLRALERRVADLTDGILDVRMVPLLQIFDKLARVVRKLTRGADKRIDLAITGGDVELDKLIVEELSDPLMHIIRNAIDHGIESPGERVAAGKPEVGTIEVQALQHGDRVILTVRDDGRGIDELAVADAAVRKGLVDPAAIDGLSRRELIALLFLPGMSTRTTATELSGRGVGLDVVKTNIANLSGIIDVTSTPGHGTTVTITLPVTLAIIGVLVARVAGRIYAIPVGNVVESVAVSERDVRTIEGREVVTVRNRTLRVARLERLFRLARPADEPAPPQRYLIVVGVAEHRVGLMVDELDSHEDVIIKSLGSMLSRVPGLAGAAELPGQKLVLVLDVPALVDETMGPSAGGEAAA